MFGIRRDYCFEDETIWNKFVDAEQLTDGNCGGQHALCAGDLSANEADSLWGTPFCETEHLMPCAPNGSHYSSGHLTNRHRCWQNGGDAADIACARALCEATPECGGYTISTAAYAAESYGKVLYFQTVAIERPDGDNWRYECWRKPQWETPTPQTPPDPRTRELRGRRRLDLACTRSPAHPPAGVRGVERRRWHSRPSPPLRGCKALPSALRKTGSRMRLSSHTSITRDRACFGGSYARERRRAAPGPHLTLDDLVDIVPSDSDAS